MLTMSQLRVLVAASLLSNNGMDGASEEKCLHALAAAQGLIDLDDQLTESGFYADPPGNRSPLGWCSTLALRQMDK